MTMDLLAILLAVLIWAAGLRVPVIGDFLSLVVITIISILIVRLLNNRA